MGVVGIDVGARRLHAVALDEHGRVTDALTFAASDAGAVVGWAEGASAIGIDSPDRWSTAPHACDASLSPKFRTARCGEIALGAVHGIWVPWTTPVTPRPGTWISAGIDLFAALRARGHDPREVYPHGVFRVLNDGVRPPPKRTTEGRQARVGLLRAAGVDAAWADMAGHDLVDATAAALVALHHAQGRATPATCGHDGSAIWLPGAVLPRGGGQRPVWPNPPPPRSDGGRSSTTPKRASSTRMSTSWAMRSPRRTW